MKRPKSAKKLDPLLRREYCNECKGIERMIEMMCIHGRRELISCGYVEFKNFGCYYLNRENGDVMFKPFEKFRDYMGSVIEKYEPGCLKKCKLLNGNINK
jgi:hypothetical protein